MSRFTLLVLVGFLMLWAAAWKGWLFRSDRQYSPRQPDPGQIAVPQGYRVEVLASGLNAPSALEILPNGSIYIAESGYGGAYAATAGYEGIVPGRLLRLSPDGTLKVVAGDFNAPVGGFFHDPQGNLFVSHRGVITVIGPSGRQDILSGLPSWGDHKNNQITWGPGNKIYLVQGTVTNSGIMGLDNWILWGRFLPGPRDIPCRDLSLKGVNATTADPRSVVPFMRVQTGAYSPFGQKSLPGQVVRGELPCNGAVMRFNPDGTDLELVAWGLRNPFDLRFGTDGALYATDNGPDSRGSRPFGGPDLFHRIRPGAWYGWPDYWNGQPVTSLHYRGRERPQMLLAKLPAAPERAFMVLGNHVAAAGFDFAPPSFGFEGQAFIAQWGSAFPATTQNPAINGFDLIRVDLTSRKQELFATNRRPGPASLYEGRGGFERPVSVRFGPDGAMYVLDWGHLAVTRKGPYHVPDTGVLWRISKGAGAVPSATATASVGFNAGSTVLPSAPSAAAPSAVAPSAVAPSAVAPSAAAPSAVAPSAVVRPLLAASCLGVALWLRWRRRSEPGS